MNLSPTLESPVTRQEKMATVWDEAEQDGIGEEVLKMSTEEIIQRTRLLDSEIKIMKSEVLRVTHELQAMKDKIKENSEKIKVNKTLPYLVSNVIELLDVDPNDQEEDGANIDLDSQRKGKCAVIKTSTRQTYFLPVIGLVDAEKLKPGDLVVSGAGAQAGPLQQGFSRGLAEPLLWFRVPGALHLGHFLFDSCIVQLCSFSRRGDLPPSQWRGRS